MLSDCRLSVSQINAQFVVEYFLRVILFGRAGSVPKTPLVFNATNASERAITRDMKFIFIVPVVVVLVVATVVMKKHGVELGIAQSITTHHVATADQVIHWRICPLNSRKVFAQLLKALLE